MNLANLRTLIRKIFDAMPTEVPCAVQSLRLWSVAANPVRTNWFLDVFAQVQRGAQAPSDSSPC